MLFCAVCAYTEFRSVGCMDLNFNLGHNLEPRKDRTLIFHMCIPCDKTFNVVP